MNLNEPQKDIRYSLGDINEEKFESDRILLAMRKVINALNYDFHLNKTRTYYSVIANKRTYILPNDFYFLNKVTYNNTKLEPIFRTNDALNINATSDNTVNYVITDNNPFSEVDIQPTPTLPTTTIHIISSLATDITFDIDKVIDVRYDNDEAYVYYDKLSETITATIEADYGLLIVDYIGALELDLSATVIAFPHSFYDILHFKVVADLLADDNRQEVLAKSQQYYAKYAASLKTIQSDSRYKYVFSDLLTVYTVGV